MDIALVGPDSLKLKGKKSTVIVNPTSKISKTEAETIIVLGAYEDKNFSKVDGSRIVIDGPGEYEVNGIKVSVVRSGEELASLVDIDNVKVLVGGGAAIEKVHDKVDNCNIVVVYADKDFDHTALTSIEPNVILVYGSKKEEVAKSLGKSDSRTNKFSATSEKLPEDLQVFVLG